MIRKERGEWVLRSRKTGRVLGRHKAREDAIKQEVAIKLSQLRRQGRIPPRRHRRRR